MKNMTNKLITVSLALLGCIWCILSCDDMNDIHREYADREEQVYLGKVDSIRVMPGFGRAKIIWHIGSDPKIEQTVIYWNQREDSIVKNFTRKTPGIQKDSIIVENLPEGSTLFEFRNVNNKGETSLFTSAAVTAWGKNFVTTLQGRKLISTLFDYEESEYALKLSPAAGGDSVIYSQILYTDDTGAEKMIRIDRGINDTILTGFSDGKEFRFRNVFFLPQGIDTIYSDYQIVKSPKAVFEKGRKIIFAGDPDSRYSEHTSSSLYEWNLTGDLILYELNQEGLFMQTEIYPNLVSRSIYREFFFYDNDKFIGISNSNLVSMHQIVNGELTFVKATSSSGNTFGSGFNMLKFIPAKGFFYSVAANTGDLRTWFANNNATWNSPNGTKVGTEFSYEPVCLFNQKHLIGVDANGYLWSYPISTVGSLKSANIIGSGWNKFVKLVSVGTKLLAMDANGDFYEFDFNATDNYWILD